ncbi:Centromere protein C [Apodemus speciosus]|uniref:Centromere protein C n=1 Tax=Apodemus speciosus TaxID=105296 RepID=A0ABQ0ES52_APOSI
MASFHLDHLKNYHRRFCRPSRAPNIHTKKGQNMLKILEDCFEDQDSRAGTLVPVKWCSETRPLRSALHSASSVSCSPAIKERLFNSTESLTTSTPKEKVSYSQSAGSAYVKHHIQNQFRCLQGAKKRFCKFLQNQVRLLVDQVKANEVHQESLCTDAVSKSTPPSNKMSSKKQPGHHGASDALYLSVGSPMVLRDAKVLASPKDVSSAGPQRVASVTRSSGCMQSSNTDFPFKTKKRLNFEEEVISSTGAIENNALQVEDNTSEGQEGTSSEISQKRDSLSSEVQAQSKKSFSELYLETVKRKSKSSSVVRHTAAAPPPPSPPNDRKLLEDEFIIDGSDRGFSSQPWVTIPRKGRHLSHHMPSPENTAVPPGKKSGEKPHRLAEMTFISNTQSDKACPTEEAQLSVEENLGTTWTNELENDCRSTENKMQSENAPKPSTRKRTLKQKQRGAPKPEGAEELHTGQSGSEDRSASTVGRDKLQKSSQRNVEDCEEVRNEPIPKRHTPAPENKKKKNNSQTNKEKSGKKYFSGESKNKFVSEEITLTSRKDHRLSKQPSEWWIVKPDEGSVNGNSSKENESSVVYPNRRKRTKRNHVSENTGKKPFPSKRQKTQISSTVQKSLNVNGSGGTVSSHGNVSSSQRKPLKNIEADSTQKSLHISGPKRGSKYQNSVMTSQNVHLKSHTEEYTNKTRMTSTLNSEVTKHSVWEESGPSRFKNYEMPGINSSEMGDEKDQKILDLTTRSSNMVPDSNLHHKLEREKNLSAPRCSLVEVKLYFIISLISLCLMTVLPSTSPGVRRSKRVRLKPLEYWRGERVDYQESSSGGLMLEIISPTSVSTKIKAKRNLDKVNQKVNKKCIRPEKCEKKKMGLSLDIRLGDPFQATLAKDLETGEIVPMDLIRPRDTYHFFVEQHGLKVFKTLDTTFFSTGKLVLGPHEEKGTQHVGQDILVFYVNFGDLLCTLHETPYMITTGDSFYVPSV